MNVCTYESDKGGYSFYFTMTKEIIWRIIRTELRLSSDGSFCVMQFPYCLQQSEFLLQRKYLPRVWTTIPGFAEIRFFFFMESLYSIPFFTFLECSNTFTMSSLCRTIWTLLFTSFILELQLCSLPLYGQWL